MFDIGFPELVIIGLVCLIVIGPEQLPGALRSIVLTVGRFKRGFNEVRADIERGIGADEIKQQLHNEAILKEIERSKQFIKDTTQDVTELASQETAAMAQSAQPPKSSRVPDAE